MEYYRKVAQRENLNVRLYSPVTSVSRTHEGFELSLIPENKPAETLRARKVAVATGYFDTPKMLGVPGEDLPNVSHYFGEAHPHWGRNVTIIGAGSSAADAALELFRAGARVTMVHRGEDFRHSLKYWIRPNLENRVKEGSITAHFNSVVREITPTEVIIDKAGETLAIPTDVTFALTGYYAAPGGFLKGLGVEVNPADHSVALDPETFESNVPGLYFIGSAGFGERTSDVFIENGVVHARKAVEDIAGKDRGEGARSCSCLDKQRTMSTRAMSEVLTRCSLFVTRCSNLRFNQHARVGPTVGDRPERHIGDLDGFATQQLAADTFVKTAGGVVF